MRAGIALGSNVGDRLGHLRAAVGAIREFAEPPVLVSAVYETAPVGCAAGTLPFLNAVIEIGFAGPPDGLLVRLQSIEAAMGRATVRPRNSPRAIDLDLLYCDAIERHSPSLDLPHPRFAERRFVLEPLAEIAPDRRLPNSALSIAQLRDRLREAPDQQVAVTTYSIEP